MIKMINSSYFSDMKVVDERLTKLEENYDKIIKLLYNITNDLSKIIGGDNNNGEQEELDKSSKGQEKLSTEQQVEGLQEKKI